MSSKQVSHSIKTRTLTDLMMVNRLTMKNFFAPSGNTDIPITFSQMKIVDYIITHNDQEICQKNIDKALGVSRMTVSTVLKTMEKNGLIKCVADPNDSRTRRIILQDKAKRHIEQARQQFDRAAEAVFGDIGAEELENLALTLDKIRNNLNKQEETNV